MTSQQRLRAEHVVTPAGVVADGVVEIRDARVLAAGPATDATGPATETVAGWVVPGFVDTHVHGGGGFDYATEDPEVALGSRGFHLSRGTTTSFASLVTTTTEAAERQLATLADLAADGHVAGLHLEGPFLSPVQAGAHDPALLRAPDPATVERLLAAGRGHLAMVTLAPELPGAGDAIHRLTAAGVRVAVGHTDADDDTVAAALDAGASIATHVFNAMRAIHHREPGPVPRLLSDRRVGVEVIADGFHVHPEVLRLVAAVAGAERTILVTDAMAAAGMADGEFMLGGRRVRATDGQARLVGPDGGPGAIAGSTLTMAEAFRVMTAVLGDIGIVAAMAATNPAQRFGLSDVGVLAAGRRADLCVVDDRGVLQRVMQGGQWLAAPARPR